MKRAIAVKSFHLRHWRFRRNEAKVLCQAIFYFTDAAVRLGATDAQANELYPYALALHRQTLELYPWFRDPRCVVPPWILPPRPLGLRSPSSADTLDGARRIGAEVDTRRSLELRGVVDAATPPRLYVPFGLFPTASGRDSLLALQLSQVP